MPLQKNITVKQLAHERELIAQRIGVGKLKSALKFPRYFQIETTRLCNASCPFCPVELWDKSTSFMSDSLWDSIAIELEEWNDWIRSVCVQGNGEPLLDVKIYNKIQQLKDYGIKNVTLSTNASALNTRNARRLLDAGIDEVMLSVDSVVKERYEELRVGLNYDLVLGNIRNFLRLRDEIKPEVVIRVRGVCLDEKDAASWESFWEPMRKPHDRIYMKRPHNWGNQIGVDTAPTTDVFHPCIIPWSTMFITASGKVALCCNDYNATANLGDINKQRISEVWRARQIEEVRRLHATGNRNNISLCQGCRAFDKGSSL